MVKVSDNSHGDGGPLVYKEVYKGPTLGVSGGSSVSSREYDVKVKRPKEGGSETFITDSQLDQALAVLEHRIVQKLMELSQRIDQLEKEIEDIRCYLIVRFEPENADSCIKWED